MKEEIEKFLIQRIDGLSQNFPQISFTFGFDIVGGQHLIEVEPDTEYRNENYIIAEFEIVNCI